MASGNLINIIEGSVASKHEGRIVLQHPTSKRNIYIKEIMREMWNRQGTGGIRERGTVPQSESHRADCSVAVGSRVSDHTQVSGFHCVSYALHRLSTRIPSTPLHSTVYTTLHFPAARHMGPYDHEPPYKPSTRVCSSVREVPPALPGRVPI